MKWILFIVTSFATLSSSATQLTPTQKQFIVWGEPCCYSQEVIDSVLEEHTMPINDHRLQIDLNLPSLKEPASRLTWALFYVLQGLDVYTTDRALRYSCVEEVNPILGKSPTVNDLIRLKVFLLAPALWYTNKYETITDEDLAGTNFMMTAVVANNFDVYSQAKKLDTCRKIR